MQFNGFDFNDLFVFDLANNHQGSVPHALNIIRETGTVVNRHKVRGVFKFQFRDLDSLIHPAHHSGSDIKHIPRFFSTRLNPEQHQVLLDAVREAGMMAMCTPFDEPSVGLISRMNFDIIKIASCSARDWPLLEKAAETGLPIVFSTGGLGLSNIDDLVSFFDHRGCEFAIMHCVSLYPIPSENFHLNQIEVLRNRYREHIIGWSTHEDPDATIPVQLAVAKGARIFERHVGMTTSEIELNAYSSTPAQLDRWIGAWKEAQILCGSTQRVTTIEEVESLDSLRRGVFARTAIKKGQSIDRGQVYFAMPYHEGQLPSGEWQSGTVALVDLESDKPLMADQLEVPHDPDYMVIKSAIHEVKALLNEARISLGAEFEIEYSHHYGVGRFQEFGVVIINCINREYCKKILVQLPDQRHPLHFHKRKEETFQVLYGELNVMVDGYQKKLSPGDIQLVLPGVWHAFWTDTGCVFEEVSTTHYNDDSVYRDMAIQSLERHERKTVVDHWGRYQMGEPETK